MQNGQEELLVEAPLWVYPSGYVAMVHDVTVTFTPKEFQLLVTFVRRPQQVISREALYELVWERQLPSLDRAVDVYVRKLRAKLEELAPEWSFIHTHPRLGYRFAPERLQPDRTRRPSEPSKEKV